MAFPASPASPVVVTPSTRCGIYYGPNPSPSFTLSASGPTTYTVRDYYGTVVSSGAVTGTTVSPTAPTGGWAYGWYRIYVDGPSTGASNFSVFRTNASFVANPASSVGDVTNNGASLDVVTRGVTAMGPVRYAITSASSYSASLTEIQTALAVEASYYTNPTYADAARPRPLLVAFPGGGYDKISSGALNLYCKDETVNGATTFVSVAAGSTSGSKLTVYSPDSVTVVETYDNLADYGAASTALLRSNYVRGYSFGGTALVNMAATAIGNAKYNGVTAVVQALYPTVAWFEGPENEPPANAVPAENALKMRLFNAAVKAGNAAAKTLGPNFVSAALSTTGSGGTWDSFFAAGGGNYCDGISFHAYNMLFGDINMSRRNLAAFKALLTAYGLQNKPLWQTEQGTFTPVYGAYHPRRARWQLVQTIAQEMYGIPKEQNHVWYDVSHGFWSQPTWWKNTDSSLNPQAHLLRVFSEEVFGKTYSSAVDFGNAANSCYLGGVWTGVDGSKCAVIVAASAGLPGIVLSVTGAASLTYSDAWGNTATAVVSGGQATVPAAETPTYVRLPAGVSVTVRNVTGWPIASKVVGNHLALYGVTSAPKGAADNLFPVGNAYDGGGDPYIGSAPPTTATAQFAQTQRFDHVVVFSGFPWQASAALTDFDVQTSPDGSAWTTQKTVTVSPPAAISFTTNFQNVGCTVETFWDERHVFDVQFTQPVSALAVRINARGASSGGEPDATCLAAGGQGSSPALTLQEVVVMLDQQVLSPKFVAPIP